MLENLGELDVRMCLTLWFVKAYTLPRYQRVEDALNDPYLTPQTSLGRYRSAYRADDPQGDWRCV